VTGHIRVFFPGLYSNPFNAERTSVIVILLMTKKGSIEEDKKQGDKVTILMKREK
jgi:hypothetical protein